MSLLSSISAQVHTTDGKTHADSHLEDDVAHLQKCIADRSNQLHDSRIALANEAAALLTLHQKLYESIIRLLEQTVHGSVARGLRAHADYLASVAEGLDKKLRIMEGQILQQIYTPDVAEALKVREQELKGQNAERRRRLRKQEATLQGYESGRGMKQLAETYSELLDETRKVKADLDRFKGA